MTNPLSPFLQFRKAQERLFQATPLKKDADAWYDGLLHATSIYKAWTRAERDHVTDEMNELANKLGQVRSLQDKMKVLVSCSSVEVSVHALRQLKSCRWMVHTEGSAGPAQ